jgi:hypothetical protein
MKPSRTQYLALFTLLIFLSACTPAQVQVLPTQTDTTIAEATNTSESQIVPTQIATGFPTETTKSSCPKINPNIQFNLPVESKELEIFILNYLNDGGDPAKIETTVSKSATLTLYALSTDIDGDLFPEVAVSIGDVLGGPTVIRLYHCEQNNYQLVKLFTLDGISSGKPEFATKIFDSEPSFMIIRAAHVHGWAQDFLALGWHNSEWQIISLAIGFTPAEIALFDQNADGIKEVFIKTKTAATPGGGISRVLIDIYSWNGKEFKSTSGAMPPGADRVHYLQDADDAWKQGNPLLAVAYYEIAARDSNLSSYPTFYEYEHKQTALAKPYQQAYAYFRIVATWVYLERPDVASEYIQEMSETFPKGKTGHEFVLAVQALSNEYEKEPDFSKSCEQAVYLLQTQYPDIIPNHLGDWGVANPMYFAMSDICKLQ